MNYSIRTAQWALDKELLLAVRYNVFVEEQSVPIELECDDKDETAMHWLALDHKGIPIGTSRILDDGRIGRIAVVKSFRNQQVGKSLMSAMLEYAQQKNMPETYLDAQVQALDFYRKHGFEKEGEEFLDAGITHLRMRKKILQTRKLAVHSGNFSVSNLAETAQELINQIDRHLRILSLDLDHTVFDNEKMCDIISALARKSRYTEIRILVVDSNSIVKNGHRLLALQRRLPTSISLKTVSCDPSDIKDNLILADDVGIICQSIKDNNKIWANFNNRPVVTNYTTQFDDLWEKSIEDKNMRQLDL